MSGKREMIPKSFPNIQTKLTQLQGYSTHIPTHSIQIYVEAIPAIKGTKSMNTSRVQCLLGFKEYEFEVGSKGFGTFVKLFTFKVKANDPG